LREFYLEFYFDPLELPIFKGCCTPAFAESIAKAKLRETTNVLLTPGIRRGNLPLEKVWPIQH